MNGDDERVANDADETIPFSCPVETAVIKEMIHCLPVMESLVECPDPK